MPPVAIFDTIKGASVAAKSLTPYAIDFNDKLVVGSIAFLENSHLFKKAKSVNLLSFSVADKLLFFKLTLSKLPDDMLYTY